MLKLLVPTFLSPVFFLVFQPPPFPFPLPAGTCILCSASHAAQPSGNVWSRVIRECRSLAETKGKGNAKDIRSGETREDTRILCFDKWFRFSWSSKAFFGVLGVYNGQQQLIHVKFCPLSIILRRSC